MRAGWGIFYDRAYYPDWNGGMNMDGFNSNVAFNSSLGGLEPAFYLQDGFPQDYTPPPFISSDYRNGQEHLLPGPRRERAGALAAVEPDRGPPAVAGLHREPRLRGQPRHAPLLQQRPRERARPELPVARQRALRRVPAGRHVAARRPRALRRVDRADAELRALARPGAPALPPVLQQHLGRERERGEVDLPLVPGQGREAALRGARSSSSRTRSRGCTRAPPTTSRGTATTGAGRAASSRRTSRTGTGPCRRAT